MDIEMLVGVVRTELSAVADPERAAPMAAYMKTEMPFYGVQKAARTSIMRRLHKEFHPLDRDEYEHAVSALWKLSHREEKYLAISYARAFDEFVVHDSLGLYERLIVEGAWWDFVDETASRLVGRVLFKERRLVDPTVRSWIEVEDMWLRRTSIICQLTHKDTTDTRLLDDACTANLADTEFFIRKAIGWALREYAKADPDWVRNYVLAHDGELSPLALREATKHIGN